MYREPCFDPTAEAIREARSIKGESYLNRESTVSIIDFMAGRPLCGICLPLYPMRGKLQAIAGKI